MSEDIINTIKQKGYWRVIIRPVESFYKVDRFNISELISVVESNQVRLRGWPYPYLDRNNVKITGPDIVSSECSFDGHVEHWDFMSSGQFVHILSMNEDYIINEKKASEIKANFIFKKYEASDIDKFLEVVLTIDRFTEIYLFASNIAQLDQNKDVDEFEIIIELYDVKDRMLFIWDWGSDLWQPYICNFSDNKISFLSDKYKKDDLVAKFDSLAVDKAIKTFQSFGWLNVNEQMIRNDQKKLLERRL